MTGMQYGIPRPDLLSPILVHAVWEKGVGLREFEEPIPACSMNPWAFKRGLMDLKQWFFMFTRSLNGEDSGFIIPAQAIKEWEFINP